MTEELLQSERFYSFLEANTPMDRPGPARRDRPRDRVPGLGEGLLHDRGERPRRRWVDRELTDVPDPRPSQARFRRGSPLVLDRRSRAPTTETRGVTVEREIGSPKLGPCDAHGVRVRSIRTPGAIGSEYRTQLDGRSGDRQRLRIDGQTETVSSTTESRISRGANPRSPTSRADIPGCSERASGTT
jgi:hypothetical protein